MNLKTKIKDDLSQAIRDGDTVRRDTLRLMMAAINQVEIDERRELDDADVESVLQKQVKLRQEAIVDFTRAGRTADVENEQIEIEIIEDYLPEALTSEEIKEIAQQVIIDVNAQDIKDMGRVMGPLMAALQGRGDGRVASDIVRELLQ